MPLLFFIHREDMLRGSKLRGKAGIIAGNKLKYIGIAINC